MIFSHTLPYLLDCILSVFIQFSVFPCTEPRSGLAPPNTLSHKNSNYPKGIKKWKECEYFVFCAGIRIFSIADTSSSPNSSAAGIQNKTENSSWWRSAKSHLFPWQRWRGMKFYTKWDKLCLIVISKGSNNQQLLITTRLNPSQPVHHFVCPGSEI